ncbi:MAG: hypothetical protein LH609_14950 [Rudanella sp.]|nr:hypothetical protein [Rudanella sp.]
MRVILQNAMFLLFLISNQLMGQQINFNGLRIMHNTGTRNIFLGQNSGVNSISTNTDNVFVGTFTGNRNTASLGSDNTFIGSLVGTKNTGHYNTFVGKFSGYENQSGRQNCFLGGLSGDKNETGNSNTFLGYLTGRVNITGNNNTIIGSNADVSQSNLTNAAAIGYNARVAVSNAIVLGDPTNTSLNVGIGTDSPQFPLDVRGIINLRNRGTIKFSHLTNPNLRNGSTDQFLTVDEQGETVLARYRLSIQNPNQWSDKVFTQTYQLRPLASVAAYVEQHGHLPGVPSAAEVVREGVDIAKLNATLLEKIEELTLYSIQLEKANQKQQADIDELKRLVKQALRK